MGNIINYVKDYGNRAFDELSLNEVDSLVLAQLAYFKYCQGAEPCTLDKLFKSVPAALLTMGTFKPSANTDLIEAILHGTRFANIVAEDYVSDTDGESQKQFSAITFHLTEHLHYISFRGTDASLIGWKEDFNLAFLKDIPSQRAAADYVNAAITKYKGDFILGGHSKGGNLAVYAAVMARDEHKERIKAVYNHDGPGFLPEMFELEAYKSMSERIYKTVPQTAIVGLLLEEHEHYTVINSSSFVVLQHDPFSWLVNNGSFETIEQVDRLSKYTNRTINAWLNGVDMDTRRIFIDSLYGIISGTNARSLSDLVSSWRVNIKPIYAQIKTTDPEVKKVIMQTISVLIKVSASEMKKLVLEAVH